MSRSKKKFPACTISAGSMHRWKKLYNRKYRSAAKLQLANAILKNSLDNYSTILLREKMNIYDSPLDGSHAYWKEPNLDLDPEWHYKWKKSFRK